jgi:hypothetical protein
MATKVKCATETCERDASHKGLCSGCYGKQWRLQRKAERVVGAVEPKLLTAGDEVIEGEIVHDEPVRSVPETRLVATNPVEMQAERGKLKAWLEDRLTVLERDIVEANAALNEARRNGWATGSFTSARNRAVDDETYYNKILAAVEAGHTIIPDFPIQVFAVRTGKAEKQDARQFQGSVIGRETFLGRPVQPDCSPAGIGTYRNPAPQIYQWTTRDKNSEGVERLYTIVRRTGEPSSPIQFPSMTALSPIMRATAAAMKVKVFDQVGVCHPTIPVGAERRVEPASQRAGDPLVIGQILRASTGRNKKQRCVSFIIAWHLNLNEL